MELTDSQKMLLEWQSHEPERVVATHVRRIVENAIVQAAAGDIKLLALLLRVADEPGSPGTNYVEALRAELKKVSCESEQ